MSDNKRSFFATIPGLVTGLAGLLTGIVGLITVLIQLDVIGGDNDTVQTTGATTTTVTADGGTSSGGGSGASPTTEVPRFAVSPATLDFASGGPRTQTVRVTNESNTASLTVLPPDVTGKDAGQFSASSGTCNAPVGAGLSCELRVTFAPAGPLRTYEAVLEVSAQGARAREVRITASSVLG